MDDLASNVVLQLRDDCGNVGMPSTDINISIHDVRDNVTRSFRGKRVAANEFNYILCCEKKSARFLIGGRTIDMDVGDTSTYNIRAIYTSLDDVLDAVVEYAWLAGQQLMTATTNEGGVLFSTNVVNDKVELRSNAVRLWTMACKALHVKSNDN